MIVLPNTVQYARFISSTCVEEPTDDMFPDNPGWRLDDALLREHGFYPVMPVEPIPLPDDTYDVDATGFALHRNPTTTIGPFVELTKARRKTAKGYRTVVTPAVKQVVVKVDTSYIEITDFDYIPKT